MNQYFETGMIIISKRERKRRREREKKEIIYT